MGQFFPAIDIMFFIIYFCVFELFNFILCSLIHVEMMWGPLVSPLFLIHLVLHFNIYLFFSTSYSFLRWM